MRARVLALIASAGWGIAPPTSVARADSPAPAPIDCAVELASIDTEWETLDRERFVALRPHLSALLAPMIATWRTRSARSRGGVPHVGTSPGPTMALRLALDSFVERSEAATTDARAWEAFIAYLPVETNRLAEALSLAHRSHHGTATALGAPPAPDITFVREHLGWLAVHAVATALPDEPRRAATSTYFAEDRAIANLVARTDTLVARCAPPRAWVAGSPFVASPSATPISAVGRPGDVRTAPTPAPTPEGLFGTVTASVVVDFEHTIFATDQGVVADVDPRDGSAHWARWFGSPVAALVREPSSEIVVAGLANRVVLALDASGTLLWIRASNVRRVTHFFLHDTTVVAIHSDGRVLGFAPGTGDEAFRLDFETEPLATADAHSIVLVSSTHATIGLVDLASGTMRWRGHLREALAGTGHRGGYAVDAPATFDGGRVILRLSLPPVVLAFDRSDGSATVVRVQP